MARRKAPENETPKEKTERQIKEKIANGPSRSEKVSWNRKMDNMVKRFAELAPIEDEILALMAKKQPIFDEIQEIRQVMVNECIHPFEYLVMKDTHVLCKFCNRKIALTHASTEECT